MTSIATVYSSADVGAPQLSGQFGSLVALLDAVLVNGYGVGSQAKSGAGWTIAFSAVNKRVYRNNTETGTGTYLRVDDSSGDARIARVRAYEAMSSVDVGTGASPTVAQSSGGRVWVKSGDTSGASRVWEIIATNSAMYVFISALAVTNAGFEKMAITPFFAGDIDSYLAGDGSRFMVMDNHYQSYVLETIRGFTFPDAMWAGGSVVPTNVVGNLMRPYTQAAGSTTAGIAAASHGLLVPLGAGGAAYPDPVAGGLLFERALVMEATSTIRGTLPGVLVPLHVRPFADGEVITDLVGLPGTVLRAKTFYSSVGSNPGLNLNLVGQLLFDMSGAW